MRRVEGRGRVSEFAASARGGELMSLVQAGRPRDWDARGGHCGYVVERGVSVGTEGLISARAFADVPLLVHLLLLDVDRPLFLEPSVRPQDLERHPTPRRRWNDRGPTRGLGATLGGADTKSSFRSGPTPKGLEGLLLRLPAAPLKA